MKRKQKHYTSEKQILDKIDTARADYEQKNTLAELNESLAKQATKAGDPEGTYHTHKDQAIKYRKQAKRIEEVKLKALGEALSEFRTAPIIPILGEDNSVASLV